MSQSSEIYGTKYDNTLVMTFYKTSKYNYLNYLIQFGIRIYEYQELWNVYLL